eukprot:1462542-Amphidinium_carterae.1
MACSRPVVLDVISPSLLNSSSTAVVFCHVEWQCSCTNRVSMNSFGALGLATVTAVPSGQWGL